MKKNQIIEAGMFVESVCGSDNGKIYIVVGRENNGYLLLSDGKRHKLSKPKRRNAKHIAVIGNGDAGAVPSTDAAIVTAIRRLKF